MSEITFRKSQAVKSDWRTKSYYLVFLNGKVIGNVQQTMSSYTQSVWTARNYAGQVFSAYETRKGAVDAMLAARK